MEANDIVTYGNDILRKQADEIDEFDENIKDLIQTMYKVMAASRGLGLAGPQIGISKRICVYDVGEGPHALLNPTITHSSGQEYGIEGCLSIPGLQGEVPRYTKVTVTGVDETGQKVKMKADGLLARVFQHEIDHLDGIMFIDKADPDTLETVPIGEDDEEEEEHDF